MLAAIFVTSKSQIKVQSIIFDETNILYCYKLFLKLKFTTLKYIVEIVPIVSMNVSKIGNFNKQISSQ